MNSSSFIDSIKSVKHLKIILFIIFSIFLLVAILIQINPVIQGDGFEYVFMTESIFNHFSFDLQPQDIASLKANFEVNEKLNDWNSIPIRILTEQFSKTDFLSNEFGYFNSLDGKKYCYHFWFYSLLCLPMRFFLNIINGNVEWLLILSNWLIFTITLGYIILRSSLPSTKVIFIALFFSFSSVYWYFFWTGPEVFTMCFCLLCMIHYYEEKYYLSILFAALAATQNPPVMVLVLFVGIRTLIKNRFTLKNLFLIFITGFPTIVPTLFYLYHFHLPSIIVHEGYINSKLVNFTRIWGVFFDLNQGIILSIPILMFIFLFLYGKKLLNGYKNWNYDLLILPTVVGMALVFASMKYWNLGIMILRYGTWTAVPIIVYTIMNVDLINKKVKIFFVTALLIQILNIYDVFNIFGMGGLKINSNQGCINNSIAHWVICNYPELYNPDPEIFGRRALWGKAIDSTDSPIKYYSTNKNGIQNLHKVMVHQSKVKELPNELFNKENIKNLEFINGWAYINY